MTDLRKAVPVARDQLAATSAGVIARNGHPSVLSQAQTTPVSGTIYGMLVGLRAGDVVTGIQLFNNVAASGTAPTTARFGLADGTGKILVLSANLNAAATWTLGSAVFAFTAPYTVLADGGYFACFIVNGTWGTTAATPVRSGQALAGGTWNPAGAVPWGFSQTGQTDLPSIGASATITSIANLINYFVAVY